MIIEKLCMENFKSHGDTEINFDTGISIIIGENGAGKSSILEAISFALFKQYSGKKVEHLMKNNETRMRVELDFIANGRTYRVLRERKESGLRSRLQMKEENRYHTLLSKDKEVTNEIQKLLDIDSDLFLNAIYVRQGEISDLVEKSPAEKKQMIGKLLGIDALEKAWKNMKFILDKYNNKKSRLEGKLESLDDLKRDYILKKDKEKEIDGKIQNLKTLIQGVLTEFKLLKEKKEILDSKHAKFEKSQTNLNSKKQILTQLENNKTTLNSQFLELKRKEQEIESIKPKINKLNTLKSLYNANEDLKHFLNEEKRLQDILNNINKFKTIMDENEVFYKDYSRLKTEINNLQYAKEKFQGNRVLKDQYLSRKTEIEDKIQLSTEKIINSLKISNDLLNTKFISVEELKTHLEIVEPETKKEIENLSESIHDLQKGISNLQVKNQDLKNPIEELEKVKEICPVCKSTITPEKRDELIKNYTNQIETNKNESLNLKLKLEKIKEKKKSLELKYSKLSKINIGILEEYLNSMEKDKKTIINLDHKIQDLTEKIIILEGVEKDINNKRKILDSIQDKYENYIAANGSLDSLGDFNEHSKNLDEIKNNINSTKNQISNLVDILGDYNKDISEEISYLDNLNQKYQMLLGEVNRKEALIENLENIHLEIRDINEEIITLKTEIGSLNYNKNTHEKVELEWETANEKLTRLNEEKYILIGQKDQISQSLEELEKKITSYQVYQKELTNLKDFIKLLELIRDLYSKDGVQLDLRKRSRDDIIQNTRNFFEKFNFEYSDINLDDDYNITLYGPGGRNSLDMISGGEKIAVALALRLGITQTIAKGNLELIMLDEPTIHLDTYRRQELIDLLKRMSIIPQMIIVTHESDLEEAADNIFRIKKENGTSKLTIL